MDIEDIKELIFILAHEIFEKNRELLTKEQIQNHTENEDKYQRLLKRHGKML